MSTTNAPQSSAKTGNSSRIVRLAIYAILLLVVAAILYLILTPSGQLLLGDISEKGLGNWLFGEGNKQEELAAAAELEKIGAQVVNENDKITSVNFGLCPKPPAEAFNYIAKLTFLNTLNLSNTDVSDDHMDCLKNKKYLTSLLISGTPVSDAGLGRLTDLPELHSLHASHAKITDKGLEQIAKCNSLTVLNISNNDITDEGMKQIAKLPKLVWLMISGTKITDAGFEELAAQASKNNALKELKHITYGRDMKISPEAISKLKKALPDLDKVDIANPESPSSRPPANNPPAAEE